MLAQRRLAICIVVVLALGCRAPVQAPSSAPPTGATGASSAATGAESPVTTASSQSESRVEGVVRYEGANPLRVKRLTNDIDVSTCGEKIQLETVVMGEGGAVANVFVELRREDGSLVTPGPASPAETATASIKRCSLEPHVLVVPSGSALEIRNLDGILHDLLAPAVRNEPLEARLPRYRKRLVVPGSALRNPEKLQVSCDVHPFEVGWWIVTDNPLRALTTRDGRFAIEGVPPGTWQLMAWHEDLGRIEQEVTVLPGAPTQADLAFR